MLFEFGQVIKKDGDYYLYLAFSENFKLYHLAKIISKELTEECERVALQLSKLPRKKKNLDFKIFDFILLNTPQFKGQSANYNQPQKDTLEDFDKVELYINKTDKKQLYDEIMNSDNAHKGLIVELKKITPPSDKTK